MKGAFAVGGTVTLGVATEWPFESVGKPELLPGDVSVDWGSEEPPAVGCTGAVVSAESDVLPSSSLGVSLGVSFVVGSGGFDVSAGLFVDAGGFSVLEASCDRTVVARRASNRNKSNEELHRMISYSHDGSFEQGKGVSIVPVKSDKGSEG